MIIRFLLLSLLGKLASIANLLLAPVVVLFADKGGWLPKWLWWFQTPDNPLAAQVQDRWFPEHDTPLKRWLNNVAWLYRNSMYGMSETLLGFTVEPGFTYSCEGDENVGNKPLHEGLVKRTMVSGGKSYWQWYYVKAWGAEKWRRCIRINAGYKLWGGPKVGDKISIVFSANPIMGYLR